MGDWILDCAYYCVDNGERVLGYRYRGKGTAGGVGMAGIGETGVRVLE